MSVFLRKKNYRFFRQMATVQHLSSAVLLQIDRKKNQSLLSSQRDKMFQPQNSLTRSAFHGTNNSDSMETKFSSTSDFQTSSDLNQRLGWQPQQPHTMTSVTSSSAYPHVSHQPQRFSPHNYNYHGQR